MTDNKSLIENTLKILEDVKAIDIISMDVTKMTSITDYMVICSGSSSRHVKTLAEHLMSSSKQEGFKVLGNEGLDAGEWALVDLGDVVVHIMRRETRDFYQLEKLWTPIDAEEENALQEESVS